MLFLTRLEWSIMVIAWIVGAGMVIIPAISPKWFTDQIERIMQWATK